MQTVKVTHTHSVTSVGVHELLEGSYLVSGGKMQIRQLLLRLTALEPTGQTLSTVTPGRDERINFETERMNKQSKTQDTVRQPALGHRQTTMRRKAPSPVCSTPRRVPCSFHQRRGEGHGGDGQHSGPPFSPHESHRELHVERGVSHGNVRASSSARLESRPCPAVPATRQFVGGLHHHNAM